MRDTMPDVTSDPHPPHPKYGWNTCPTPPTAMPGDEWTCPGCGREYLAIDDDGDDGTFEWMSLTDDPG